VTILRDKWGIPHVFGKTDADAVFGMVYAQAEDDFNRVELNYINAMGRLAEVEGEKALWRDLRMKLYIDPADMKAKYAASPAWLKKLMNAWADGLNWYLATHPQVKPKLITRFEPWMALLQRRQHRRRHRESIDLKPLEAFYGKRRAGRAALALAALGPGDKGFDEEPRGSNGFAIAPRLTAGRPCAADDQSAHLVLLPPEVHMVSEEGLNAYGAVTWGQFFIYQGFNDRIGWMHTSGGGDVIDEYLETVVERNGKFFYKYGGEERAAARRSASRCLQEPRRHGQPHGHGLLQPPRPGDPAEGGKWVAVKMMDDPMQALMQSYGRTKARNYAGLLQGDGAAHEFLEQHRVCRCRRQYRLLPRQFHAAPRSALRLDPSGGRQRSGHRLEGPARIKETITLFNPASGYISNTNNWPCTGFGASSPDCEGLPGLHVVAAAERARHPRRTGAEATRRT
jgi:acyl-homoserine-lactone acylase